MSDWLDYYLGPTGIPDRLRQFNALLNPVETIGQSMQASQTMFAPETSGWGRVEALGNMLSGVAGTVAPMVAANRLGVPVANAVVDSFTGFNPSVNALASDGRAFMADEFGGVKLYGGGAADPTQTGWTFRDYEKPNLSRSDNARISRYSGVQEAVVPIRSMYATQPRVNADFAETSSSAGELPFAIRKDGKIYLMDGHHRIVRVAEEGSQNARVRLMDLDSRDTSAPLLNYDSAKAARDRSDIESLLLELFSGTDPQPSQVNRHPYD